MKEFIRNFFFFTSRERNGTIILAFIIFITIVVRLWITLTPVKNELPLNDTALAAIKSFIKYTEPDKNEVLPYNTAFADKENGAGPISYNNGGNNQLQSVFTPNEKLSESHELFFFDPNTASLYLLIKAGFSRRVAETIINYRNSGGKFRKVEDINKIYGLTTQEYEKVKNHIKIESPVSRAGTKPANAIIELNKADSALLVTLNGIGLCLHQG
jgi:DNA uptake protein ComE-like DNA-binding protein